MSAVFKIPVPPPKGLGLATGHLRHHRQGLDPARQKALVGSRMPYTPKSPWQRWLSASQLAGVVYKPEYISTESSAFPLVVAGLNRDAGDKPAGLVGSVACGLPASLTTTMLKCQSQVEVSSDMCEDISVARRLQGFCKIESICWKVKAEKE